MVQSQLSRLLKYSVRFSRFYAELTVNCTKVTLSRFFLENSGPTHLSGDRDMLPFLVNMAELFELFVAEWLRTHLPAPWIVKSQEIIVLDSAGQYRFKPDLVIYHRQTRDVRCVLDTKYKVPEQPAHEDIAQVIAYAHFEQSDEAVLIYPTPLTIPLDTVNNGLRIRSVIFNLDRDIEEAGRAFLCDLGLAE